MDTCPKPYELFGCNKLESLNNLFWLSGLEDMLDSWACFENSG